MAEQRKNRGELDDFEQALSSLTPRCDGVNRDQLMYLAGQASVEQGSQPSARTPWLWPASTTLSTAAALLMAVLLFYGPDQTSSGTIARDGQSARQVESASQMEAVEQRFESSQDQHSSPSAPPRSAVAQSDAAPDAAHAVASRDWALFVNTRRAVLTRGLDAIPELEERIPRDPVVASTYWSETNRLLPRQSTQGMTEAHRSQFSGWKDLFMTGETL